MSVLQRELKIILRAELKNSLVGKLKRNIGPGEKERRTRLAKQEDFVMAYRMATSRKRRVRLFVRLWFLNMKSRDIALGNVLLVVAYLPGDFTKKVLRGVDGRESTSKNRDTAGLNMPKPLRDWTPASIQAFVDLLDLIMYPRGRNNVDWPGAVLSQTKQAVSQIVLYQVFISLLETVMVLVFSGPRERQERKHLLALAKGVGVKNTSSKNMDQLRLEVANGIIEMQAMKK
jgi:hypothetical protein